MLSLLQEFTLAHLCRRPYFNDATNLAKFTNLLRSRDDLIQRVIAVDLAFGRNFGPYRDTYHSSDTNRELADMMSVNYFLATMRNLRRVSISCTAAQNGFIALAPWVLDTLGSLRHLEELSGVSIGSMRGDATEVSSTTLARLRLLRKLVNTQWVSPLCLNESAPWSSIFTNLCALEIRQMPHGTTPPVLWGHLEVMECAIHLARNAQCSPYSDIAQGSRCYTLSAIPCSTWPGLAHFSRSTVRRLPASRSLNTRASRRIVTRRSRRGARALRRSSSGTCVNASVPPVASRSDRRAHRGWTGPWSTRACVASCSISGASRTSGTGYRPRTTMEKRCRSCPLRNCAKCRITRSTMTGVCSARTSGRLSLMRVRAAGACPTGGPSLMSYA